jgi:hypothetical protein
MPSSLNIGDKFGLLTVIRLEQQSTQAKERKWFCQCDCGNSKTAFEKYLKSGETRSCGCLRAQQKQRFGALNKTHGRRKTRLYEIWAGMKKRCLNPNSPAYRHYGGRGIKICDEWMEFEPFANWADKSGYRHDLTIERVDVNGHYSPSNCCWATKAEQALNKRNSRIIEAFGESKNLISWVSDPRAKISSINTLHQRLEWGWDPEKAISTPPSQQNRKNIFKICAWGETKSLKEWGKDPRCNVSEGTLRARIACHGYPPEEAISFPLGKKKSLPKGDLPTARVVPPGRTVRT